MICTLHILYYPYYRPDYCNMNAIKISKIEQELCILWPWIRLSNMVFPTLEEFW